MQDVTADYHRAVADPNMPARATEKLRDQHVVLVPGFLTEAVLKIGEAVRLFPRVPALNEIVVPHAPGQYFDAQIRWLERDGIRCVRVPIESEAPIPFNADAIRAQLPDEGPITIISHSKGCLDVLDMLLRYPDVWPRIREWIAIQGPFLGTPIADFVTNSVGLNAIADHFLSLVAHGSPDSLRGMRTDERRTYHQRHAARINDLLRAIPTVSVSSSTIATKTFLAPMLLLIEQERGGPNDGLVPVSAAHLSGSRCVELQLVDHAMPVMRSMPLIFEAVQFTQALLCL